MELEVSVKNMPEYLHANLRGTRSRASVKSAAEQIYHFSRESNQSKVLIDVRELSGRLIMLDILSIVLDEFPKYRGEGLQKAALIDRPYSVPKGWFLETFAQNRGFALRIFDSEEQAVAWLFE